MPVKFLLACKCVRYIIQEVWLDIWAIWLVVYPSISFLFQKNNNEETYLLVRA